MMNRSPALPLILAWRALVRRPRRLVLFVAGVTVAAATLLDMVMLSAGLQRSLARLLEETGYQVRVTPRGTLPFETESTIPNAARIEAALLGDPRVTEVAALWGQRVYVMEDTGDGRASSFAAGIPSGSSPTLRLRSGRTLRGPGEVVLGVNLARRLSAEPGDSIRVGWQPDPAVGGLRRTRVLRVTGIADFPFAPEESESLALELDALQQLAGASERRASLLMVRTADEAAAYDVAREYRGRFAGADIFAIPEIIAAAGDRLTYFQQLSNVLGTVSVGVAFLLIVTLLTLSVNDRRGEIATLRAIGVTRPRILAQITWQGLLLGAAGAAVGLGLGRVIAAYLDTILRDFPGLPASVSFFVLYPRDALLTVLVIVGTGTLAGLYPAWRGASLNIASELRREIA